MKIQADKKRREVHFQIGEWVYVKLKPYRQLSVRLRIHPKLAAKFFGPFQILDKIGEVAYKLQLPPTSKIHPVFHVSLLKKAVQGGVDSILPPELIVGDADALIPEAILDTRMIRDSFVSLEQWLVQWQGQARDEATSEDALWIQGQFPDTCLEDKTAFARGNSETERFVFIEIEIKKTLLQAMESTDYKTK
ncbi:hypothetical protein E3N88_00985 [Mikania micrantha]|uniref:Tf2-1-like SH3-like domain-containing protein n=1 Tax=Mikania micrantha TaxID=192012 RepID=A0A5N6PZQ9_9ASTR|nr:hypothetical protein E3N88_00985 [Mikania micrantha]